VLTETIKGTIDARISYQLRNIYYKYWCCLNVATFKWNVNLSTIAIINVVIKLRSMYRSVWYITITQESYSFKESER
jgi:hypothetical protein